MTNIMKNMLITAGGIGATIAGVILIKKSTLKCNEIIKEHMDNKETIEKCANEADPELYTEEDFENDVKINNAQTVIKIVKTYMLPVGLTVVGGFIVGNGIINIYKVNKIDIEGGVLNE